MEIQGARPHNVTGTAGNSERCEGIVKQPSSPNKALLHLDFQKAFDSMPRVNTDQVLRPRTAQIARHQFEDDLKNGSGTACFT